VRWPLWLLVAGCDGVFGLDHVSRPLDAPTAPFDALLACTTVPGHDEDHDGIADDIDDCPEIANADQLGTMDGDDIGGACDPHPTSDDERVLFVSFAASDACWPATDSNAWGIHDDAFYGAVPASGGSLTKFYYAVSNVPPAEPGFTYRAHVVIDATPNAKGTFAIVANKGAPQGQILSCALIHDTAAGDTVQAFLTGSNEAHAPTTVVPGGYSIELRYDQTTASCKVTPDGQPTIATGAITFAALPVDHLAIALQAISAHVDWVVVYRP